MAKEEQAAAEQPEGNPGKKKLFIIIGAAAAAVVGAGKPSASRAGPTSRNYLTMRRTLPGQPDDAPAAQPAMVLFWRLWSRASGRWFAVELPIALAREQPVVDLDRGLPEPRRLATHEVREHLRRRIRALERGDAIAERPIEQRLRVGDLVEIEVLDRG